jgi:ribosomal protein S18 acetylase RimI-like enzyme
MARWIDPLATALRADPAFGGCSLRPATLRDEALLYALHRDGLREYVEATWGWEEDWQRAHFAGQYQARSNAVIVRCGTSPCDIGRVSLTRHWRKIFLRDIELFAAERNRGIGSAVIGAVLSLARDSGRHVDLLVLKCNPAQRLYDRLGFRVIGDDGARLRMRAL